ncbi:Wzz/FepE/Etk N-terminal domain-containing protein [Sphingomonas sp. 1P06PA]|uniref:Wzz/FepE/Etk N-terminal domain-containing protein n=1 Tax=Sphingomonas sp. 1P06PA TaxID=554121 RepID=UPI0039A40BE4
MNMMQIFMILKARFKLVALVIVIGIAMTVAWILLGSDSYRATAQVIVNVRAPETVGAVTEAGIASQLQPDYLSTQVEVIRSDRVAAAAVRKLGMLEDPQSLADYRNAGSPGTPSSFFANRLTQGLTVLPSNQSRVIAIDYKSPSAQNAAAIANAFAEAYRDVSLDLQADPARQAASWYERATADLRRQLSSAQEALSKRRAELGVTASGESIDADDARLGALSQQLAMAQAAQAQQSSRTSGGALPDAMINPVVAGLTSDIARLEAQRRQLATFAGPNNVDYRQVSEQLSTLRAELAKQRGLVSQSAQTAAQQSSASVGSLQAAVDAQRGRVIAAQRARGEIAAMEQDVLNLRKAYEDITARQTQSQLLGAASQTNISVLSPATVPTSPDGLPWILKLMSGTALSIFLALIAAFAREFMDQRMRVPEDASAWLGIPNLGGVRSLAAPPQRLIGQSVRRYLPHPSEGTA